MPSMATPCTTAQTNLAISTVSSPRTIAVALQRGEGVDERLEGARRLGGQLGLARLRVDEAAEHHAIVRRVGDGEANVGDAHRVERRASAAALLPRRDELLAQRAGTLRWRRPRAARACRRSGGRARCARRRAGRRFRAGSARRRLRRGWWRAPRRAARGAGCRDGRGGAACGPPASIGPCHLILPDMVLTSSTLCGYSMLTLTTSKEALMNSTPRAVRPPRELEPPPCSIACGARARR